MNQHISERLKLFITEAERLENRSFYQHFKSGEEICFSDDSSLENIPTVEQMESYLLHFRKFIQQKDHVCIDRVNQDVHELAQDQHVFLNEWNELYTNFKNFLDAKALTGRVITHVPEIPDLSLLKLFKTRTYGDLSHLDPEKQALHQKLSSSNHLDALYRFEYYTFLSEAGELIFEMAGLCKCLIGSVNNQI
jgi:hypothetical protein